MGQWRYATHILNLGPIRRSRESLTPWPLHTMTEFPEPTALCAMRNPQLVWTLYRLEPRLLGRPARSLFTVPTALYRLLYYYKAHFSIIMLPTASWLKNCSSSFNLITTGRIETYQIATYSMRTLLKMDYWSPKHVELLNVMNEINHQYSVSCWITDTLQNDTRSIQYQTQRQL